VSPDVDAMQRARLEAAGWEFVESRSGKSLWWRPGAVRFYTLRSALKHANAQERGVLEAAGWEVVEGEREPFWRRPDTGRLYAQAAALEVVRRKEKGAADLPGRA
jgi:hypothetical protein